VMRVRGLAAANEAGPGGDEPKVLLVAIAPGLGHRQDAPSNVLVRRAWRYGAL
jgi:hypothetical protein